MKRIGLFIGFLTVLAFLVPAMIAQDAKKDADKTDKKDEKKDPDKKDEKKEPEKKEPEKKKEKFVHGQKLVTKIVSIKPDSNREFTIELQEVDQKKVAAIDQWVESGVKPSSILASHMNGGGADRTRPLCAYPAIAHYIGTGSTDEARNFRCQAP